MLLVGAGGLLAVLIMLSPYVEQDPEKRNFSSVVLFYVSSAIFLTSFFCLFLYKLRRKIVKDSEEIHMGVSLRQGILLAIIVVVILILQSFRVLTWWDGLLAVGAVLMIELYFLAR